jgi:hypothetical protein
MSGALELDAWFFVDLGVDFNYCKDGSQDPFARAYAPLERWWSTRWKDLTSKHCALSPTLIRARLMSLFRESRGEAGDWFPSAVDATDFEQFSSDQLQLQGLDSAVKETLSLSELLRSPAAAPIVVCSVCGALLSQAVLTAVSARGEPMESLLVFSGRDYVARSIDIRCGA